MLRRTSSSRIAGSRVRAKRRHSSRSPASCCSAPGREAAGPLSFCRSASIATPDGTPEPAPRRAGAPSSYPHGSQTKTRSFQMAFSVPDLPYDYDALEPHIDEATMRVHHDKHHQAYVDKANAALEGTEWADKPVEEVVANLGQLPEDRRGPVRNNAGAHANHSLFWQVMSPDGGGEPEGDLASAIDSAFGGFEQLKGENADAAVDRFGSRWGGLR